MNSTPIDAVRKWIASQTGIDMNGSPIDWVRKWIADRNAVTADRNAVSSMQRRLAQHEPIDDLRKDAQAAGQERLLVEAICEQGRTWMLERPASARDYFQAAQRMDPSNEAASEGLREAEALIEARIRWAEWLESKPRVPRSKPVRVSSYTRRDGRRVSRYRRNRPTG